MGCVLGEMYPNALISVSLLSGHYYAGYRYTSAKKTRLHTRPTTNADFSSGRPSRRCRSAPLDRLACHRVGPSRSRGSAERTAGRHCSPVPTGVVTIGARH